MRNKRIDEFDPRNITQAHMDKLAACISSYVDFMEECVVIQDNAPKGTQRAVEENLKLAKKLIHKLEHGDISVFKDEDEWNPLV